MRIKPKGDGFPEVLLFFLGMIYFLRGLLDLSILAAGELYATIVFVALVSTVLGAYLPEKYRKIAYDLSAILAFLFLVLQFQTVKDGCFTATNHVMRLWNALYEEWSFPLPSTGETFAVWLFLLSVCLLLYWGLCRGTKQLTFGLMGILTVLILVFGTVLDCIDGRGFVLLLGSLVAYWMFLVSPFGIRQRIAWTMVYLCVLGAVAVVAQGPMPVIVDFRDQTKRQIELLRFGADTLPEGDLHLAWKLFDQKEMPRLSVRSSEKKDLYLRGFTGDRYVNGVWKPLPNSAFQGMDSGMLSWLYEQNFYPLMQYGRYCEASEADDTINYVNIENQGANRRYYYESYSISPDSAWIGKEQKDNRFTSHAFLGIRKTQFQENSQDQPTELLTAEDWLWKPESDTETAYMQAEKVYRDFVYRHYTAVSEDLSGAINEVFHEEELPDGVYAATVRIRSVMEQKMHYQEQMEEIPQNRDPIRWFLRGNSGNAVLYASTAVEAFRSFGIPARYVEGYLYTAEQAQGDGYAQELTSENAHAWCEIYMDGMGWMPVDVTPGHYYNTYAMMELLGEPEGIRTARIAEENSTLSELPDDQTIANEGRHTFSWQKSGSILLGCLILMALIVLMGVVLALILRGVWLMVGRSRAKRQETTYIDYTWHRIRAILRALGITAELGMGAEAIDGHLRERMPEFQEGMYLDLNQVMEHFYYGGENGTLKPYEVQLLLRFYERLEQEVQQLQLREQLKFWLRDIRQLLKREEI